MSDYNFFLQRETNSRTIKREKKIPKFQNPITKIEQNTKPSRDFSR